MPSEFAYTLIREWFSPFEQTRAPELASLLPHQRQLLLSDGSLTLEIQLLWKAMVEVEVRFNGLTTLGSKESIFLEETPDKGAIEREVWLTIDSRRLVYAHSLIPVDRIDKELMRDIDAHRDEPLGRVLTSKNVRFSKKKIELGVVRCEAASTGLGLDRHASLIARRYILHNIDGVAGHGIKAAVTEVFSPEIIEGDALSKKIL